MSRTDVYPYCRVTYWRDLEEGGQVACDSDHTWSRCRVEPATAHSYPDLEFTRGQDYELRKLLRLLAVAYESGQKAKAAEVREVLGLKR